MTFSPAARRDGGPGGVRPQRCVPAPRLHARRHSALRPPRDFETTKQAHKRHWWRRYRRLSGDATGDIAPSGPLAGRLAEIGCDSAKVHASPCGIDLPERGERGERRGRQEVFLAVGRLVEKKSPLSTLRALAKMVG